MALLMFPLLAFVAAQDTTANANASIERPQNNTQNDQIINRRATNGTKLVLECPAAIHLIKTHMAPDFENPQLVRRLDWIHIDSLVASFQQELVSHSNQQWWVSNGRFELHRPFFELRILLLLPQDAGKWHCHLETDPLFAAELPQRIEVDLVVLVRPPIPPKPSVIKQTDHSVHLQWANYSTSTAHLPILRFSVMVTQPDNGSLRVLSTKDNQTNIEIPGLRPNTRYAFSVRAENIVGESAFGPEALLKAIGIPPRKSPQIRSLKNGTSADCVELKWDLPDSDKEATPIIGFRVMVHHLGTGVVREWYIKGEGAQSQVLCSLQPYADYILTIEADNGFGYSGTTAPFRTDQSIPEGPPLYVQARPLLSNALFLSWKAPLISNGLIRAYIIYYEEFSLQKTPAQIKLDVRLHEVSNTFVFNLTRLAPNTRYKIHLAALTDKGEGPKSEPIVVDTDFIVPESAPKISFLSFGCDNSLLTLEWLGPTLPEGADGFFNVSVISLMENKLLNFNISADAPYKMVIENIHVGDRLSIIISLILRSRSDVNILLEGPSSEPVYFVLIANGWRCRFRSSICPSDHSLPPRSECEHFSKAAPQISVNDLSEIVLATDGKHINANVPFFFLIFGTTIAGSLFVLFIYIMRRRCLLSKSLLHKVDKKYERRGTCTRVKGKHRKVGEPENMSLVGGDQQKESVILPPINVVKDRSSNNNIISNSTTMPLLVSSELNHYCDCAEHEMSLSNVIEEVDCNLRGPIVNVLHFESYFEKMSADACTGFRQQFQEIESETSLLLKQERTNGKECGEFQDTYEKNRNRYMDICALPKRSRILLERADNFFCRSQYINANFVDSCDEQNAYIATQAPLPNTFSDFWAIIWQERCQVLVALTNTVECGRKKCDRYWPEKIGSQVCIDEFSVTLTDERANAMFIHRILQLRNTLTTSSSTNDVPRIIHQLHFILWPDHGVPDTAFPLLHFINYVAEVQFSLFSSVNAFNNGIPTSAGPCLVHCSAGVGRSGAFILIDSLRRHLLHCDRINLCGQLRKMRHQRAQLVQTFEQFIFCHEVLRHLVSNGITRQPRTHFPNYCRFLFSKCTPSGQQRLNSQYINLLACKHIPHCKPTTKCVPLPGYHRIDEFLCGMNIDSTELWRVLWETKCQAIVLLDLINDENSLEYQIQRIPSTIILQDNMEITTNKHGLIKLSIQRCGKKEVKITWDDDINGNGHDHQLLLIRLYRVATNDLLECPWIVIENLQTDNLHGGQIAILEISGPNSLPPGCATFLFCALQSAACQLEKEAAVDILLWLVSYRHLICGCWTSQNQVELVYKKVLELVE